MNIGSKLALKNASFGSLVFSAITLGDSFITNLRLSNSSFLSSFPAFFAGFFLIWVFGFALAALPAVVGGWLLFRLIQKELTNGIYVKGVVVGALAGLSSCLPVFSLYLWQITGHFGHLVPAITLYRVCLCIVISSITGGITAKQISISLARLY